MVSDPEQSARAPWLTMPGLICVALGLLGCLAVFNATFHLEDPFDFLLRQVTWLILGTMILMVATRIDGQWHRKLLPLYVLGAIVPLILVLFLGIRVNQMRGWFAYKGVFYQPSEIAKPVFVLTMAWVLEKTRLRRNDYLGGFLPVLGVLLFWTWPIVAQPDFGSLLVYGLTCVILCLGAGVPFRHLATCLPALAGFSVWVLVKFPYTVQRFLGFADPEAHPAAGWHIIQFHRSLASGGLFGQSWGKGVWSQQYLPLGYSDSIFATLGESIGFVGLVPFVALVVAWTYYGYRRQQASHDPFATFAIQGLTAFLSIQAFIHLSVNLGLLPPTGLTLPLISYGGSSLFSTAVAVGLVESLSRNSKISK